jgi:hypothetical protein
MEKPRQSDLTLSNPIGDLQLRAGLLHHQRMVQALEQE